MEPEIPPGSAARSSEPEQAAANLKPETAGIDDSPVTTDPELAATFAEAETLFSNFKQQCNDFQQVRQEWTDRQVQGYTQPAQQHQLKEKFVALELDLVEEFSNSLSLWTRQKFELLGKQEEFWQFIRYAGLGFVLGIVANSLLR